MRGYTIPLLLQQSECTCAPTGPSVHVLGLTTAHAWCAHGGLPCKLPRAPYSKKKDPLGALHRCLWTRRRGVPSCFSLLCPAALAPMLGHTAALTHYRDRSVSSPGRLLPLYSVTCYVRLVQSSCNCPAQYKIAFKFTAVVNHGHLQSIGTPDVAAASRQSHGSVAFSR